MVKKLKIFTSILLVLVLFLPSSLLSSSSVASSPTGFGDGTDGSLTINTDIVDNPIDSSASGVVGTNTLSATNVSFTAGQQILIHQTRGVGAGAWERNKIVNYSTGIIATEQPLQFSYSSSDGNDRAQVLVLKQYSSVTVDAGKTWTVKPWDGTTGGILAFLSNETFTNNGTVTANGGNGALGGVNPAGGTNGGFRGGQGLGEQVGSGLAYNGEGTSGPSTQSQFANGNGGPGAIRYVTHESGGGGGGNGTQGGQGNIGGAPGSLPPGVTSGALPGGAVSGTADLTIMTFGGGGGGGEGYIGHSGGGGAGGGIIFINAKTVINTGIITSNGGTGGTQGFPPLGYDAAGGGGAGGSILIKTHGEVLGDGLIIATGGIRAGQNAGAGGEGRIHIDFINEPPTANAGGPYSVPEGGTVILTGSGSDPDGDLFSFTWDLDNNGTFETPGQIVTFSAAVDGPGSQTVVLQVCDDKGACSITTTTVDITNVAPTVGAITAPAEPVLVNTGINTSATFTDVGVLDTHTAIWDWGDGMTSTGVVTETNGSGSVTGSHTYTAAGVYTVTLIVTDKDGGSGQNIFQYVVIFDSTAGFVTGAGIINSPAGAYSTDPSIAGRANFGFSVKYLPGETAPNGGSQFKFRLADINFTSTSYQWLVISGSKATFRGVGTNNGGGDYTFLVSTIDGAPDRYRIKITDNLTNSIFYDNEIGSAETSDPTTPLVAGSVVIH